MPDRVQLRRVKGYRKPEGAIVVARPSKWGNPFTVKSAIAVGYAETTEEARPVCVEAFRSWLTLGPQSDWWYQAGVERFAEFHSAILRGDLRGHDLACWCPLTSACHADVLLEVANA